MLQFAQKIHVSVDANHFDERDYDLLSRIMQIAPKKISILQIHCYDGNFEKLFKEIV